MSRKLTASDRKRIIRLAATLPKGPDRQALLRMARKPDQKSELGYKGKGSPKGPEITERDINNAATLSGVDPQLAAYIVQSGLEDGNRNDDKIPMGKATVAAGKLKPSQTTMQLPKTLGMAISMILGKPPFASGPGGDLGAIISADNHILDGHHRWSASIAAAGPGVSVGGYKAKMRGSQLLKVLNLVTKGKFRVMRGNPGSGNIKAYTPANAEKVLREMVEKGTKFLSPDDVKEALTRLGGSVEEGIAQMSKNIGAVSKAVPSWAPDRSDMPVINESDLATTSQMLNKGVVNWNKPLKTAMLRLASTLPKGSSERRTLLAMLKSAGASRKRAYGPGKKITVKDLEMIGGNGLSGDEDLEGLARMLNSASGMRGVEKAMREADKVLDTFGIESVFEEGEYGDPAMMYLNTGDTYNATLVYDVGEDELYASTWGDWVEHAELEGRRFR